MNIKFLVLSSLHPFTYEELVEHKLDDEYPLGYLGILQTVFNYDEFAEVLIKSRKNIGIPCGGVSIKEYSKIFDLNKKNGWSKNYNKIENPFGLSSYRAIFQEKIKKELISLNKIFKLHKQIKRQLPHVLLANVFVPIFPMIMMYFDKSNKNANYISITIVGDIKKSGIVNYLNKNSDLLNEYLEKLPGGRKSSKKLKTIPDELGMKIIELKNKKRTYSEIINELDELGPGIDENYLSKTHGRAKALLSQYIEKT